MNTDGLNSGYDINLSGDSDAYFDTLTVGTFQGVTGAYFTGITSNIQTQINGLTGTYVTLGTAQNITGQKTFNTTLPTSTITPANAGDLTTKTYNDATYGRLAIANTWALTNTFSTGILPRASSSATDIQMGGANQLQYRRTPSAYNVSIGENAVRGYPAQPTWNVGVKNIGIGDSALQNIMGGSDNIACGYQSMQICGDGAVYGQTVTPSQNVAIGTGSQKTNLYGARNISLGYNSYPSNVGGIGNVIIAANGGGGLSDKSYCVIIGDGACPTASDNGIIAIGSSALGASTGGANSVIAIGQQAGYNNRAAGCLFIGTQSGFDNLNGYDNQFLGYLSGIGCQNGVINQFIGRETRTTKSDVFNSCCVGYKATTIEDREFVVGGFDGGAYPRLTLPEKTRLACNLALTGVTVTLAFRTNENILLTDATTTTINLPTPNTNGVNEGCKFYINRKVAGVNITINAPAGQTMALNQINGTYTASSTYLFLAGMNSITVLCIGSAASGTNWMVLPTSYAQGTDNVNVIDKTGILGPYYMNFTSGVSGNLPIYAASDLYYDPLSRIFLLSNGTLQSYKTNSTCFQYLGQAPLITTATSIAADRTYYPFTMKTAAAYAVTVPLITSVNVGTQLVFKRIGGSLQALSFTTVSNQPTFLSGNAIGTTTASNVIISATQSCCKIIATETQPAGTGTFTNLAGSATITIDTQTTGTLSIGGIINCNGNVRYITAYLTGLGGAALGANTYTVNAVIAAANSGQNYTSSLTYGWCVESVS